MYKINNVFFRNFESLMSLSWVPDPIRGMLFEYWDCVVLPELSVDIKPADIINELDLIASIQLEMKSILAYHGETQFHPVQLLNWVKNNSEDLWEDQYYLVLAIILDTSDLCPRIRKYVDEVFLSDGRNEFFYYPTLPIEV